LFYGQVKPAVLSGGGGALPLFMTCLIVGPAMSAGLILTYLLSIAYPPQFKPHPAYCNVAYILRQDSGGRALSKKISRAELQALADLPDEIAFLQAVGRRLAQLRSRLFLRMAIILVVGWIAIVAGLGAIISRQYWQITDRSLIVHGLLKTQTFSLRDTKFAEVECTSRGGLRYRLQFEGYGLDIPLGPDVVDGLNHRQVIQRIDQIDQQLGDLKVSIRRPYSSELKSFCPVTIKQQSAGLDDHGKTIVHRLIFGT
jgi:hypothetical protein